MKKAVFNWSGGKDSSLCLHYLKQSKEYEIATLLTSINTEHQRISMHGVRCELLKTQVESLGIPLKELKVPGIVSMEKYDTLMREMHLKLRENGIGFSIFGDIFLEDLRVYREEALAKVEMEAVFPLWKKPTNELVREFISLGFKAIVVCTNDKYLDQSFVGREINQNFLNDLPANVDPCGENGEFHSFVYDGPIFDFPIECVVGDKVHRIYKADKRSESAKDDSYKESSGVGYDTGFWYCDLLPTD